MKIEKEHSFWKMV